MFSNDVDHSKYLVSNLDELDQQPGFPYCRFNELDAHSDDEQIIMAMLGDMSEFLIVTNKKVVVYKIPRPKSFFKKAVGLALDNIPVVSDVMDGAGAVKDFVGGAKNAKNWVTGKNKRLAKEREAAQMPSKKDFKDVTWNLKKPDILALLQSYRDDILMANGFGWKEKFKEEHLEDQPTKLLLKKRELKIQCGKMKWNTYMAYKDEGSYEVIKNKSELFKNTTEMEIHGSK